MTMKKGITLLSTLLLCLALCACGEPASHSHSYSKVITPPSCTEEGYTTYTCACGDSYIDDPVEIVAHNYQETARIDATSHQDGSVTHTCSICGHSYEEVLYATGSVGLEYEVNNGGAYTVIGLGTCTDSHVVIPAYVDGVKVTGIDEYAFYDCSRLTDITILEGVTSIGRGAFYDCSSLTSITIPGSVTSIGLMAFSGCSSLTSITIPEGVTSIGEFAFSGCSSLASVTFGDSVTSIGGGAFSDCSSLISITIPGGVTSIGWSAFSDCSSLTSITIPDSVTSIGDRAFSGCSCLTVIHFGGTKTQWKSVVEGYSYYDYTIRCIDGDIIPQ